MHLACCLLLLCRMAAGHLRHSSSAARLHPLQEHAACSADAVVPNFDLVELETAHQVCCRWLAEQQQSNSVHQRVSGRLQAMPPRNMACALALPAQTALGNAGIQ